MIIILNLVREVLLETKPLNSLTKIMIIANFYIILNHLIIIIFFFFLTDQVNDAAPMLTCPGENWRSGGRYIWERTRSPVMGWPWLKLTTMSEKTEMALLGSVSRSISLLGEILLYLGQEVASV